MVDELLLNSFIWPAAIAMSMQLPHTRVENDAVMLASQNKAVKSIREHIDRNDVSDSVVFAVLALTIRDTNSSLAMQDDISGCSGGFDPPLRSLGWNQYLSRFRWADSHMYALKRLVAARGGLRTITTPGVAEQVQSTDILQASLSLTSPNFTLSRLYEHVVQNQIEIIRPPRKRIEDVFPAVTDADLQDPLLDMRMYCRQLERIVDEIDCDGSDSSVTWETNVNRNLIQYRLLHLPTYRNNDEEICRLGALIFSFGVIYPVARRKPLLMLVAQLEKAFKRHDRFPFAKSIRTDAALPGIIEAGSATDLDDPSSLSSNRGTCTSENLLWTAILGALAAKSTDHEAFFIDLVREFSSSLKVDDYMELKDIMHRYLWLGRACDTGAFEVWRKVKGLQVGDTVPMRNHSSLRLSTKRAREENMYNLICTDASV